VSTADAGGDAVDRRYATVRAASGDDLRAAGTGWAQAAALLDRRADALVGGLDLRWDSPAGRAHAERLRELIGRMRATADLARYNHAQLLVAADATDTAIRELDAATATRGDAVREIAGRLDEAYANAVARLTEPRWATDDGPSCAGHGPVRRTPEPAAPVPAAPLQAAPLQAAPEPAVVGDHDQVRPVDLSGRDLSGRDLAAAATDIVDLAVDTEPPELVGWAASSSHRPAGPASGTTERFAVSRPAAAPASTPRARPTGDTYTDKDSDTHTDPGGHRVRIRWSTR
jgi:hypothetical protein